MPDSMSGDLEERKDLMRLRPYWNDIAQDMIATTVKDAGEKRTLLTAAEVCAHYKMTPRECKLLFSLTEFRRLLKAYQREVDAMGDTAPIKLRARMMAGKVLEKGYLHVMREDADTRDVLNFAKVLINVGGLDPSTNGENKSTTANPTATALNHVNIFIPSQIPGMDHLRTSVIENGELTDEQ